MADQIISFFSSMPDWLSVFFLSMIPLTELRASIPFAIMFKNMPWFEAYIIAIIGNFIPVTFILLLSRPIFKWMKSLKIFKGIVSQLEGKIEKHQKKVLKYQFWGLALFVGIPLPGTGAWTGAFLAAMLDIRIKRAIPAIIIGLIIAATIMVLASNGIFTGLKFLIPTL